MIKEQRRRKKRRKIGLLIALTLLFLIGIAVFVVLKVYTVENVIVEGNEMYSDAQIKGLIFNDEYSWNSLYVNLKYRFQEIGDVPFVDTVEVSLDDPHTVRIVVYEKGVLGSFYITAIGRNAYFDKDGFVVETSSRVIEGVPRVTGISCDEVVLYEKLPLEDEELLPKLLALTQMLNKYELLPEEIHYDENLKPILTYGDILVEVGSDDYLSQKVVRLAAILPQLQEQDEVGTLHLETWTPDTTDITFDRLTE